MIKTKYIIYLTIFTVAMLAFLSITTIPALILSNAVKVSATALLCVYFLYYLSSDKVELKKVNAE